MPGFHPDFPPLKEQTVENYTRFVNYRINDLSLDRFVLAGISFGFLLATKVAVTRENCLAILGSGPYLEYKYVNFFTAINFYKTLDTFMEHIDTNLLRVIVTRVEHYPQNPTYEYFKEASRLMR